MSVEIVRFGVGHRRPQGPPGTVGLTGAPIHGDERGVVAELAFSRGARIEPHSNPNISWFVVIEGGGWVQVGDESARVAAGEAVLWPPGIDHSAWTDYAEMRAIVVEFAPGGGPVIEGRAVPLLGDAAEADGDAAAAKADGELHQPDRPISGYDVSEGEPL